MLTLRAVGRFISDFADIGWLTRLRVIRLTRAKPLDFPPMFTSPPPWA
jgi:hypothetical protein